MGDSYQSKPLMDFRLRSVWTIYWVWFCLVVASQLIGIIWTWGFGATELSARVSKAATVQYGFIKPGSSGGRNYSGSTHHASYYYIDAEFEIAIDGVKKSLSCYQREIICRRDDFSFLIAREALRLSKDSTVAIYRSSNGAYATSRVLNVKGPLRLLLIPFVVLLAWRGLLKLWDLVRSGNEK
jgi:hypothetical protein